MYITSKGIVTVSGNSEINNNNQTSTGNEGLYIANTAGTGTVSLSNTDVDFNKGKGITILSNGNILLSSVEAENNVYAGALLNNSTGSTATITVNTSWFEYDGGLGLTATSKSSSL